MQLALSQKIHKLLSLCCITRQISVYFSSNEMEANHKARNWTPNQCFRAYSWISSHSTQPIVFSILSDRKDHFISPVPPFHWNPANCETPWDARGQQWITHSPYLHHSGSLMGKIKTEYVITSMLRALKRKQIF